jgi:hypothetical protein
MMRYAETGDMSFLDSHADARLAVIAGRKAREQAYRRGVNGRSARRKRSGWDRGGARLVTDL